MLKVLVADDDAGLRASLSTHLKNENFMVSEACDGTEVCKLRELKEFDLFLLDVDMPGKNGIELLKEIKLSDPSAIVIILTAFSNIEDAIKATKLGAYNYLSKPVSFEKLSELIKKALTAKAMVQRIAFSAPLLNNKDTLNVGQEKQFLAKSKSMQHIFALIEKLAKVDTAVLIRGESGTGKELVAKALHHNSLRKDNKFVAVNCSAIPENLIESEFFGHEKGAFTGANERKIGKFQYANGGTLFLDEIGDISTMMQVKLLRVLQEKKFTPVGSNREIEVDVRIVAATNRNLEDMIKANEFREDLYYRLNVLPIYLPSLKDRTEDIEVLVSHFINQFNLKHEREINMINPLTLSILKTWTWPGNIRELENVIERSFVLESTDVLMPQSLPAYIVETSEAQKCMAEKIVEKIDNFTPSQAVELSKTQFDFSLLPSDFTSGATAPLTHNDPGVQMDNLLNNFLQNSNPSQQEDSNSPVNWSQTPLDYHNFKDTMEKEFIIRALKSTGGKINQTSRDSGIPKKTLLRKIQKFGINRKDYSPEKR